MRKYVKGNPTDSHHAQEPSRPDDGVAAVDSASTGVIAAAAAKLFERCNGHKGGMVTRRELCRALMKSPDLVSVLWLPQQLYQNGRVVPFDQLLQVNILPESSSWKRVELSHSIGPALARGARNYTVHIRRLSL